LAVGCWLLAVGFWLLAVGFWLLAFGFWLLAVGCWLLAFGFSPQLPGSYPLIHSSIHSLIYNLDK
jgi:hypothetical protein